MKILGSRKLPPKKRWTSQLAVLLQIRGHKVRNYYKNIFFTVFLILLTAQSDYVFFTKSHLKKPLPLSNVSIDLPAALF